MTHVFPVAQPRQRQRIVKMQGGKQYIHNYTPTAAPVNAFKANIQQAFSRYCSGPPFEEPVGLRIAFVFPRPKYRIWSTKPMHRYWRLGRPDLDNLEKAVMDALNKLAWRDDAQVAWKLTTKLHCSGIESPHVLIEIFELPAYETIEDVNS